MGGAASAQGGQETSSGGVAGGIVASYGGNSSGGESAGGEAQGGDGCIYQGRVYRVGETFNPGGGCDGNWCTCHAPNSIGCTLFNCPNVCQTADETYWSALEEAKRCDPTLPLAQCTELGPRDAACECATFVNPGNEEAMRILAEQRGIYEQNACRADVTCAPCGEPAQRGYCSERGRCEAPSVGASCVVNGRAYPSGSWFTDPVGCNTCECWDGMVASCTLLSCERPCPPDTALGLRCVKCGEKGLCDSVEYGCFPGCLDGACSVACG